MNEYSVAFEQMVGSDGLGAFRPEIAQGIGQMRFRMVITAPTGSIDEVVDAVRDSYYPEGFHPLFRNDRSIVLMHNNGSFVSAVVEDHGTYYALNCLVLAGHT